MKERGTKSIVIGLWKLIGPLASKPSDLNTQVKNSWPKPYLTQAKLVHEVKLCRPNPT